MVYFKANENLFDHIRGISCYCNGKQCSPSDIFDIAYSGLEDLIKFNRAQFKRMRKTNSSFHEEAEKKRAEKYFKWLEQIPEDFYIKAKLKKHKGSPEYKDLRVLPRTNIPSEKDRIPNVVYLQDEKENTLIMRIARTYLPGKNRPGNYEFSKLKNYQYKKLDPNNTIEWVEKGNLKEPKKHSYQYIPEPYLTVGLEEMYKEGFPRVTPRVKTVYQEGSELVTIRPMLMLAWDHSLWTGLQQKLGDFLGNLYGINLLERADRQIVHYAIQKPKDKNSTAIVNYDPDFFVRHTFTGDILNQIVKEDFTDFKNTLKDKGTKEDVIVIDSILEHIYDKAMTAMHSEDIQRFRKDFLDFFPNKLESAKLPNSVENI